MKTGHASDGMPRFSWVYTVTLGGCTRKAGDAGHDTGCAHPPTCVHHRGRSGFTREYGGGSDGERRVEIGQQARPFRG